jgi:hypothetical protein
MYARRYSYSHPLPNAPLSTSLIMNNDQELIYIFLVPLNSDTYIELCKLSIDFANLPSLAQPYLPHQW